MSLSQTHKHTNTHTHTNSLSSQLKEKEPSFRRRTGADMPDGTLRHGAEIDRTVAEVACFCGLQMMQERARWTGPLLHPGEGLNASSRLFVVVWSDYILAYICR